MLDGCLEAVLAGYQGAGGRLAEWLSRGVKRDMLHVRLGGAREAFARAEGVCWLLSHMLCTREM